MKKPAVTKAPAAAISGSKKVWKKARVTKANKPKP